jgi:hypothetical protein
MKKRNKLRTGRPVLLTVEQRQAFVAVQREAAEIVADIAAASAARSSGYIRESIDRQKLQAKAYV